VYDIIQKFHATAQQSKTILLPQCGIDSVPSDLLAYRLAKYIRDTYGEGTDNCVASIQAMKGSASGGTAATALSITSAYPIPFLIKSMQPFALSPIPPSKIQQSPPVCRSLLTKILGYVTVPDLGHLTPWMGSNLDRAIVHRSWGLFGGANGMYGSKFRFELLLRAKTAVLAFIQAWVFNILGAMLLIPPARWLLKKAVHEAGSGASREESEHFFMKYKAVATSESGKRVIGKLDLLQSPYYFTGVLVATAALEILRGDGQSRAVREGGVVTSAMLEMGYSDRLEKVGVKVEITPM
jgi:short subunit dehydrogenase-like uncharacterized protein